MWGFCKNIFIFINLSTNQADPDLAVYPLKKELFQVCFDVKVFFKRV